MTMIVSFVFAHSNGRIQVMLQYQLVALAWQGILPALSCTQLLCPALSWPCASEILGARFNAHILWPVSELCSSPQVHAFLAPMQRLSTFSQVKSCHE